MPSPQTMPRPIRIRPATSSACRRSTPPSARPARALSVGLARPRAGARLAGDRRVEVDREDLPEREREELRVVTMATTVPAATPATETRQPTPHGHHDPPPPRLGGWSTISGTGAWR